MLGIFASDGTGLVPFLSIFDRFRSLIPDRLIHLAHNVDRLSKEHLEEAAPIGRIAHEAQRSPRAPGLRSSTAPHLPYQPQPHWFGSACYESALGIRSAGRSWSSWRAIGQVAGNCGVPGFPVTPGDVLVPTASGSGCSTRLGRSSAGCSDAGVAGSAGSVTVTTSPPPSRAAADAAPPWLVATAATIESPSPAPPLARERDRSTRKKGSKS